MTSLHVICGLGPHPIKNPGYTYGPTELRPLDPAGCEVPLNHLSHTLAVGSGFVSIYSEVIHSIYSYPKIYIHMILWNTKLSQINTSLKD